MSIRQKTVNLFLSQSSLILANVVILIASSRLLLIEDYATYRQTFMVYEVAAPFLSLGLTQTIFYFLSRSGNSRLVIYTYLKIITFSTIVFSIFLFFGGAKFIGELFSNNRVSSLLYIIIPFTLFNLSLPVFNAIFIVNNKTRHLLFINTLFSLFTILSLLVVLLFTKDAAYAIITRVFSYFLLFLFFLLSFNSVVHINYIIHSITASEIIKFSLPVGIGSMVGILSSNLDKLLVSTFFTPVDFSVYINGAFEIPLISLVTTSLASASISEMSIFCQNKDFVSARNLFIKTSQASSLILMPLMIFFLFTLKN